MTAALEIPTSESWSAGIREAEFHFHACSSLDLAIHHQHHSLWLPLRARLPLIDPRLGLGSEQSQWHRFRIRA